MCGVFVPLTDRCSRTGRFLSDEFNLASPDVVQALYPLLENKPLYHCGQQFSAKPGFAFFATQNESTYASRNVVPPALRSRFVECTVGEFPPGELAAIICRRQDEVPPGLVDALPVVPPVCDQDAGIMSAVYFRSGPGWKLSMREMVKWVRRAALFRVPLCTAGLGLLLPRVPPTDEARAGVLSVFREAAPAALMPSLASVSITQEVGYALFSEGGVTCKVQGAELQV